MATRLTLWRELFSQQPRTLLEMTILPSPRFATRAAWRLYGWKTPVGIWSFCPGLDR
jgi:hypothetical protein